jgi:hypothetical protein
VRFGVNSGDRVRKLDKQMVKFDLKGFARSNYAAKENPRARIGAGDEDCPDIVAAFGEIGSHGWTTAEVAGNGEMELRDVLDRLMNGCLRLTGPGMMVASGESVAAAGATFWSAAIGLMAAVISCRGETCPTKTA